jgi:hypothetical protein
MTAETHTFSWNPFSIGSPGSNWNSLEQDYSILANSVPIVIGIKNKESAVHLLELVSALDRDQLTNRVLSTLNLCTQDAPIEAETFLLAYSKYNLQAL